MGGGGGTIGGVGSGGVAVGRGHGRWPVAVGRRGRGAAGRMNSEKVSRSSIRSTGSNRQ